MKSRNIRWTGILAIAIAFGATAFATQEGAPSGTVPVTIIVSVEGKHGKEIPVIYREDVRVLQGDKRLQVKDWVPLAKEQAGLGLFLLIDDSLDPGIGVQLNDMRKFISGQPATTAIGVGYMRNGTVQVAQNLTEDHSLAANALRLPVGVTGGMSSPYLSITDLIKRWPESRGARQILMISSGVDVLQPGPNNTYLRQAIEHAQRAGVQVSSIYTSPAGHAGHTPWLLTWGQNNLSQLADETGGEDYSQALREPISFAPYLDQFADRLKHQFRLTFLAEPRKEPGFQRIRLETEVPDAELVAQDSVWVPGK